MPLTFSNHNKEELLHFTTQHLKDEAYLLDQFDFSITNKLIVHCTASKAVTALVYVLKGNINCQLPNAAPLKMKEGFSYLLHISKDEEHFAEFSPGQVALFIFQLLKDNSRPARIKVPISLKVFGLLHEVTRYQQVKLSELLSAYIKATESPPKKEPRNSLSARAEKLIKAKELVDSNEGKRLTIPTIAKKCFLNNQELKTGFTEMFGTSVGQYQMQRRMKKAIELLSERIESIHHIAIQVGYEDESSFTAKFKERYGMTPGEWRRQ